MPRACANLEQLRVSLDHSAHRAAFRGFAVNEMLKMRGIQTLVIDKPPVALNAQREAF